MQKILNGILILAVLVLGVATFSHVKTLGDATVSNYPTWYYNGIVIGPQNTLLTQEIFGTCNLAGATSVSNASTTSTTCTASGAKVGDKVFMTQPTVGGTGSFPIVAASITAADTITAVLQNQTGSSNAPTTGAITAVQYVILR